MKQRILAGILSAAMVLGAAGLAGCGGKVTAESLINNSQEKMQKSGEIAMDMDMDISMSMTVFGQSMDMDITGKLHNETKGDNSRMTGTMNMNGAGQSESAEMETYIIKNGDSYEAYSKDQSGTWTKQSVDVGNADAVTENIILATDYSAFTLSEENNQYVVSGDVDMSEAYKMMGEQMSEQMTEAFGQDTNIDFSSLPKAQLKYYFDKKSKELVSGEVEMTEAMDAMMNEIMKQSLSQSMGSLGGDAGDMDLSSLMQIKIGKAYVNLSNIQVGGVADIVLPEEAKNASEGTDDDLGEMFDEELEGSIDTGDIDLGALEDAVSATEDDAA